MLTVGGNKRPARTSCEITTASNPCLRNFSRWIEPGAKSEAGISWNPLITSCGLSSRGGVLGFGCFNNRSSQTTKSSNVALFRMGDFLAFVLTHRVGFWTSAPGGAPGG